MLQTSLLAQHVAHHIVNEFSLVTGWFQSSTLWFPPTPHFSLVRAVTLGGVSLKRKVDGKCLDERDALFLQKY